MITQTTQIVPVVLMELSKHIEQDQSTNCFFLLTDNEMDIPFYQEIQTDFRNILQHLNENTSLNQKPIQSYFLHLLEYLDTIQGKTDEITQDDFECHLDKLWFNMSSDDIDFFNKHLGPIAQKFQQHLQKETV